eukprot:1101754-Pyramimonas_sp.AAC.2
MGDHQRGVLLQDGVCAVFSRRTNQMHESWAYILRAIGAKPANRGCEDTTDTHKRGKARWADPTESFVRAGRYDGMTATAQGAAL